MVCSGLGTGSRRQALTWGHEAQGTHRRENPGSKGSREGWPWYCKSRTPQKSEPGCSGTGGYGASCVSASAKAPLQAEL